LGRTVNSVTSKLWMKDKGAAIGVLAALFLVGATTCNAQFIFHKKKKIDKSTSADNNAQPDKILYDKAMDDIKHGRHEIGRLNMQTLINTYPDSEYLAKAKLAIADSYYKEGGTSNLALAISGYKDFEVFFPFLPEATYAQMQVAMAQYRQMEKPDRDRSHAIAAEQEFQIFLEKYPNDPLAPQARQRLREVQEVLAEGEYRVGYFYYLKGDRRAAAARLLTVTSRYPLYSKSDRALWMMGDIFEKSEHKDVAARYYARIVKDYPLSSLLPDAKDKLKEIGAPIPQPDPTALAWMTAEQNAPRERPSLFLRPLALLKSGPGEELLVAAKSGAPNLAPESDELSAGELLTPGGDIKIGGTGGSTTGVVATVTTGGTGSAATTGGAESTAPVVNEGGATVGAVGETLPIDSPKTAGADPAPAGNATETPAKSDPPTTDGGAKSETTPAATGTTSDSQSSAASKDKNQKESSSKKKKGLRKLVPW
jgi:outer membrane protein assembly factor BamD